MPDDKEYKGVRQAFGSPGGKSYLAPRIVDYMPPHKVYVEPFVGGGAVFYRKYPSGKEVLNDKDQEIIFANKFIRDMTPEQFEKLKRMNWKKSEEQFKKVKAMQPDNNVERFYKFYYLKKASFTSGSETPNTAVYGKDVDIDKVIQCHDRLNRVQLSSGDYMAMIDKYDSPETLFYLDPPYPQRDFVGGKRSFGDAFTDDDLRKLIERLDKIKGKFILSLGTNSEHLIPKHWNIKRMKVERNLFRGNATFGYEILVSKQPLVERGIYNKEPVKEAEEVRFSGYRNNKAGRSKKPKKSLMGSVRR